MTSTWINPVQVVERRSSAAPIALFVASVGLVLSIAGMVFGLTPIHRMGDSCGSAFNRQTIATGDAFRRALVAESCDMARSDQGTLALALLIPGSLLAMGGLGTALISRLYAS